nr:hypothetical protein [Actinoplanes ovalisporus]
MRPLPGVVAVAQHPDQVAQLGQGLHARGPQLVGRLAGRVVGRVHPQRPGLQHHQVDAVGDHVVHLARQPHPLVGPGLLGGAAGGLLGQCGAGPGIEAEQRRADDDDRGRERVVDLPGARPDQERHREQSHRAPRPEASERRAESGYRVRGQECRPHRDEQVERREDAGRRVRVAPPQQQGGGPGDLDDDRGVVAVGPLQEGAGDRGHDGEQEVDSGVEGPAPGHVWSIRK